MRVRISLRAPINNQMQDHDAWKMCHIEDLWIFDKLLLSKKLGYVCGPSGLDVPHPGEYVIRPITNLCGMGRDATIQHIEKSTDDLPPGHFWCEVFEGRHLSVDYVGFKQSLCVEGFRDPDTELYRWTKWQRTDDVVSVPGIVYSLNQDYRHINCEFIGGKLIEVHLRPNPDFQNNEDVLYVVWEDQDTTPPEGMVFISCPDYKRKGFFKPI